MVAKLTEEQIAALQHHGDQPLQVVDPTTNQIYVLIDFQAHQQAVRAQQTLEDLEAIQRGIEDAKAGRTQPLDEAFAEIRQKLLSRNQ